MSDNDNKDDHTDDDDDNNSSSSDSNNNNNNINERQKTNSGLKSRPGRWAKGFHGIDDQPPFPDANIFNARSSIWRILAKLLILCWERDHILDIL